MTAPLKRKEDRRAYDVYETPEWAVEALLKVIPINNKLRYMEPCRGSGRIYNHLPIGSAWGEIRQGIDYLATEYPRVDVVVTNPPYSLAQEFVTKALEEADVVIMLLRLGFLESMKRWEWWQGNKPTSLLILSQRPSFTEDGKTDGAGYAWYIWDKKNKLGLEPFYFLEGQDDDSRREDAINRKQRRKANTGRTDGGIRPDSLLDKSLCEAEDVRDGTLDGDTGGIG